MLITPGLVPEIARSVLACAAQIELTVDGVPHVLDSGVLGVQDRSGTPAFVCQESSRLAQMARVGCDARIAILSAFDETLSLQVAGRLRLLRHDGCEGCVEAHDIVVVDLAHVLLVVGADQISVDLDRFADPALCLNYGYLRRNQEHINDCHEDLLRAAVACRTSTPMPDIAAASVANLELDHVELRWVTIEGASNEVLQFASAARTAAELGEHLRDALHHGIC